MTSENVLTIICLAKFYTDNLSIDPSIHPLADEGHFDCIVLFTAPRESEDFGKDILESNKVVGAYDSFIFFWWGGGGGEGGNGQNTAVPFVNTLLLRI
jgi:hypothetical protein